MTNPHAYSLDEQAAIYKVIRERRDMRHFLPTPVDSNLLQKILAAAHRAPSVGLMHSSRFIRFTDLKIRQAIHKQVDAERVKTAQAIGEYETSARMLEFLRL